MDFTKKDGISCVEIFPNNLKTPFVNKLLSGSSFYML